MVNHQIARDGEKPGTELMASGILSTAFQNTDPGILKKVLCKFSTSGQVEEVAQKSMLIFFDQVIEKFWIATSQSDSDLGIFIHYRCHEIASSRIHAIDTYGRMPKKDAGP